MNPDDLAAIRAKHAPHRYPDGSLVCDRCREGTADDDWPCAVEVLAAEVARLAAEADGMLKAEGDAAEYLERARIAEAVRGLEWLGCGGWGCATNMSETYAAVVAAIDGGER